MIKFFGLTVIVVGFAIVAWFSLWPWWLRNVMSKNWPRASGTITGGDISVVGAANKMFRCTLTYSYEASYEANGQIWAGHDTQDFYDEQTASDYSQSRKGVAAEVRYNPRKPKSSVLL